MALDEIVMSEGSWISHEPDEWYPGELLRVEEGEDWGFGPTLRFVFVLDGEEGNETWGLTSQKLSPKSKLYSWLRGIDPALIPDVGRTLQTQKLEGRRVEVMFEVSDDRERVTKVRGEKKAQATPRGVRQQVARRAGRTVDSDDEAPF